MSAIPQETVKSRLENVIALARLLDRIEASPVATDADQYQTVVRHLKHALAQELPADALDAVLSAHGSAAELYENEHYARSGLSRSTLDRSVRSEMLAAQAIAKAARRD